MGTNYYAITTERCPNCGYKVGSSPRALHIGKSSAGWAFALHIYPEKGINTLGDWLNWITYNHAAIEDEYGVRARRDYDGGAGAAGSGVGGRNIRRRAKQRRKTMKRMILMIVAALLATTANAGKIHDTCASLSALAETVAENRYAGVSMRASMGAVETNNEQARQMIRAIIQDAYGLPDYSGDEYQQRAVVEFGNDVYSDCLDSFER